jgi:4'-phosphopantetheinyl transferase EntD
VTLHPGVFAGWSAPGVVVDESWGPGDVTDLHQPERELVRDAGRRRQEEFAAGRACARRALERAGVGSPTILRATGPDGGRSRAPLWPSGIVGSITHGGPVTAAAVIPGGVVAGVGIDVEPVAPAALGASTLVVTRRDERAWLEANGMPDRAWEIVWFSAKESVFKAWSAATGLWLDFSQCRLEVRANGTFTVVAIDHDSARGLVWDEGWWRRRRVTGGDLIATAVCLRPGSRAA